VQTGYDNAGRATCVTAQSLATCGPSTAYASGFVYAANGRVSSMTLGNSLAETTTFNQRFQPTAIQAGSLLTVGFTYGTGTTGDNGNVQTQSITASGQPAISQTYAYDNVNRLQTFTETSGVANQSYNYDAFGNRTASGWIPYAGQTPTTGSAFPNNQWAAGNGVTYDNSGNQTGITSANRTFTYDAENRQTNATVNGVATNYVYDGDGRRVIKTVGSGPSTVFVYDAAGRLAAEYGGPTNPLTGTTYLTADHLGSTRMVTNAGGSVVSRFDYAPFGEELTAGLDGRIAPYSTNQYPTATLDGTSEKFTSKERDSETGVDYFGARYMSAPQGRFVTVDPLFATASLFNPQSWNGYTYTLNSPLKYVDTDGRVPILAITAAVGAVVGGVVGAAREYRSQYRESGHVTSGGRIWTAAGGGALAGLLAGGTLGIGAGAGVAATAVEVGVVNASSTVIGDFAQHRANDALGLTNPGENANELGDTLLDATTAGGAGFAGAKLADTLIPIPNVRREIELLQFASRRSTRAARIQVAQGHAQLSALANASIGNVGGALTQQSSLYFWNLIVERPVKACVNTDRVGGGRETICQ
jgi:RHS repeat-associated protein